MAIKRNPVVLPGGNTTGILLYLDEDVAVDPAYERTAVEHLVEDGHREVHAQVWTKVPKRLPPAVGFSLRKCYYIGSCRWFARLSPGRHVAPTV